jgi:hypothetical protein
LGACVGIVAPWGELLAIAADTDSGDRPANAARGADTSG